MADNKIKSWAAAHEVRLTESLRVELPLVRGVGGGPSYYSFNLIGRTAWNRIAAEELFKRLSGESLVPPLFITVESKAIALTQELARLAGHDRYIVLRKTRKSYMRNPTVFHGGSITSGSQEYWIEQDDIECMRNQTVAAVDDVISSGKTARTFVDVAEAGGCRLGCFCCALTEGTEWKTFNGVPVIALGHIPLPG